MADVIKKQRKKRYGQKISNKVSYATFADLQSGLYDYIKMAQQMTLDDMEEKLYDFIEEEVYSKTAYDEDVHLMFERRYNRPNLWHYSRTGSMYNIWEQSKPYIRSGVVYGDIRPTNYNGMVYNKKELQHMSPFGTKLTPQDYVKLINDGVSMEHSMLGQIQSRPFWDKFVQWSNENYRKIFAKHLAEMGITYSI